MRSFKDTRGPSSSATGSVCDLWDAISWLLFYDSSHKWMLKYLEYFLNSELKEGLSSQQQIMLEEVYRLYRSPEKVADLLICLHNPKIWRSVYREAERVEPPHLCFSPLEGPR